MRKGSPARAPLDVGLLELRRIPVLGTPGDVLVLAGVNLIAADHDALRQCRSPFAPSVSTPGRQFFDLFRDREQTGHRAERLTLPVQVESSYVHDPAAEPKLLHDLDDAGVEEVRLVDTDDAGRSFYPPEQLR